MDAANAIGELPEFAALDEKEQDAVQEWFDDDEHALVVLKTMKPTRGRWLKRKLGDIIREYEEKEMVSFSNTNFV
jgi:hypothetical protein